MAARRTRTVCISGMTGEGLPQLLGLLGDELESRMAPLEVLLPYGSTGDLLSELHTVGRLGWPNRRQCNDSSSCQQAMLAGLGWAGWPSSRGMGVLMDGAMQQAAQAGRQFMRGVG